VEGGGEVEVFGVEGRVHEAGLEFGGVERHFWHFLVL